MEIIEEIDINVNKIKNLLYYLIEQNYVFDETKKRYENIQIENYSLKEIYQDTSMFLDVIMDYIEELQNKIAKSINKGSVNND